MGLASYYLASKAHDELGELNEWALYNLEYIDYLENRIEILEDELDRLIKWANSVDRELNKKK